MLSNGRSIQLALFPIIFLIWEMKGASIEVCPPHIAMIIQERGEERRRSGE